MVDKSVQQEEVITQLRKECAAQAETLASVTRDRDMYIKTIESLNNEPARRSARVEAPEPTKAKWKDPSIQAAYKSVIEMITFKDIEEGRRSMIVWHLVRTNKMVRDLLNHLCGGRRLFDEALHSSTLYPRFRRAQQYYQAEYSCLEDSARRAAGDETMIIEVHHSQIPLLAEIFAAMQILRADQLNPFPLGSWIFLIKQILIQRGEKELGSEGGKKTPARVG